MKVHKHIRPFVLFFISLIAILGLTFPLAEVGSAIDDFSRTTSPAVGDSPAAECSVPGDFSTIQAAVNNKNCTTIIVGSGVFVENVTINRPFKRPLSITGQGVAQTEVNGGGAGSVFTIHSGTITLIGLLITKGTSNLGSGVFNKGNLTINNSTIGDNGGHGIFNEGNLTISSSTIRNNGSSGIYSKGSLTIYNSTVRDNKSDWHGGGIQSASGAVTIDKSTINGNSAARGGGVSLGGGEIVTIKNSIISGNSADHEGGGIHNLSRELTVSNSTVTDNSAGNGAGIYSDEATITVDNSTISGNSSTDWGGGIYIYGGTVAIKNSTISSNSADKYGGGLFIAFDYEKTVTIDNSTITRNAAKEGGGIFNWEGEGFATVMLSNTLIAGNLTVANCVGDAITSQGYNLDSDNTCNLTETSDLPNHAPLLGPLQDNGGETFTHTLLSGSPAIDAGNCPGAVADQRGYMRPVDNIALPNVADGCDMGAFELQYVTADFSASPTRGGPPLQVTFENISTGNFNQCLWDYGDDRTSTRCHSPTPIFRNPGNYTISLTVKGPGGEDTMTKTDYITVYGPPTADFSASPTNGLPPLTVDFTNLSTGVFDECLWDFGDGRTAATCEDPSVKFRKERHYTISLTVKGPGGEDTKAIENYITVGPHRIFLPGVMVTK